MNIPKLDERLAGLAPSLSGLLEGLPYAVTVWHEGPDGRQVRHLIAADPGQIVEMAAGLLHHVLDVFEGATLTDGAEQELARVRAAFTAIGVVHVPQPSALN